MFLHVTKAEYVDGYKIHIWFSDGTEGIVDLADALTGPIYGPLTKIDYFKSFEVAGHTLSWPNGADFAPEYLHDLIRATVRT